MKTHIIISAIASLVVFAANPASASTSAGNAPQSAKVERSTSGVVPALSKQGYDRQAGMHSYEMRGAQARASVTLAAAEYNH
jgi:hypothetical protein